MTAPQTNGAQVQGCPGGGAVALASQSGPPQKGVLLRTHTARTSEPLPLAAWEPLSRDQRRAAQREGAASPCSLLMWAERRWAEQQCSHPDSEARTTHSPPSVHDPLHSLTNSLPPSGPGGCWGAGGSRDDPRPPVSVHGGWRDEEGGREGRQGLLAILALNTAKSHGHGHL